MSDQIDALEELGVVAYTYLYSLVTMDLTCRQAIAAGSAALTAGPMNTFVHIRELPRGDFKAIVRPNFDTLYSLAWLDLTGGPVVVSTGRRPRRPLLRAADVRHVDRRVRGPWHPHDRD